VKFTLSKAVNSSKVFLTPKSEVAGRWDPFYFRPELVALEKRVHQVTPDRLRTFVVKMAGGATPSTTEAETHYTESTEGVPFIRVQNLSTTGRLNLQDCKRITRDTHERLLRRSRLSGGELLVKITGVGRMAVASVVPDGFEGNINQHIVAIRTRDARTSETLAAYLNLDMSEKLASRRSTGGTRPALDYPALLSIPIVFDERIPVMVNAAVREYEAKRERAIDLLNEIDGIVLTELGTRRQSAPPNEVGDRIFRSSRYELTGRRWDPNYSRCMKKFVQEVEQCAFPVRTLKQFLALVQYGISERATEEVVGIPMLRMLNLQDGCWDLSDMKYIAMDDHERRPYVLQHGDILFNRTNSKELVGKCNVFDLQGEYVFASYLMRVRMKHNSGLRPEYVVAYLGSSLGRLQIDAVSRQIAGMTNINAEEIRELLIPVPPRTVQDRICTRVADIRRKVAGLRQLAATELQAAKETIEHLIMREGVA
jgi:hypothetical protein